MTDHTQSRPRVQSRSRCAIAVLIAQTLPVSGVVAQQPTLRPNTVQEEVYVDRVIVDAYVTDRYGNPIPDLKLSEFRLLVDGTSAPIEAVEWISEESADVESLPGTVILSNQGTARDIFPGRLLIFFFQVDPFVASRAVGSFRMGLEARKISESLRPNDRVAVLSFDSHLKLQEDFTQDRGRLAAAIDRSIKTASPPAPNSSTQPSLARLFDFPAAEKAVTPEKSLGIIARAAVPIIGAKAVVFFGWGLQTIGGAGGPNPRDRNDTIDAMLAISDARMMIFTLDVTDAEHHTGERLLMNLSDATGGTYEKTNSFAGPSLERVLRATAGHYQIVFKKPELPPGRHKITLTLATRSGRVLARPQYAD